MRGFPLIKQYDCHGHDEEHTNAAAIEHALFRVDCLYEAILRYSDILPQGDLVLDPIREVGGLLGVCIYQLLTVSVSIVPMIPNYWFR